MTVGRRRLLRATAGALIPGALAGCTGTARPDGYSFRFSDDRWKPLLPIVTDTDHTEFYYGSGGNATDRATHGYQTADAATVFVHRSRSATSGEVDGLVVTFDAPDADGGRARLFCDESIDPEEHVLVRDGSDVELRVDVSDGRTRITFQWSGLGTAGVVLSTAPFSKPVFALGSVEGLESIRVLSAMSGETVDVHEAKRDSTVQFRL